MDYYISKPDDTIKNIINETFPRYNGKKIKLSTSVPKRLDSYWQGGSKDEFSFYELNSGKSFSVVGNHPFFEKGNPRVLDNLPAGILLVKHSIYLGKDMGITIYVNQGDLIPLLPPKMEVSSCEKIVLKYTSGLKPSYAGISNYRFHEANRNTGISLEEWNKAKASLIDKKLLNKAGAITAEGRNCL